MEFSKVTCISFLISVGLVTVHVASNAQQQEDSPSLRQGTTVDLTQGVSFEIAPHTGVMGGSGTFGLDLSMNYGSLNIELAGEQVIGKIANLYPLSVDAVLNLATRGPLIPYGVVGGGLFVTVPTNSIGDETVSTLGVNFGGGARYYITGAFGVRLEVKQYVTSVKSEAESSNELLFFQELSVGVTFMLH